ncbi:MAG: glycosyl transferase [Pseudomonadota bacterium]
MVLESALAYLFVGFVGTGLVEFFVLQFAQSLRLLEEPNERSSHDVPTPSLGGLAILLPIVLLLSANLPTFPELEGLLIAAVAIGALGLLDDLVGLPSVPRLIVQSGCVALALWPLLPDLGIPLFVLAAVLSLWHVNLFNFMDGIDGFAGAQAFSVAVMLLVLAPTMAPWLGYLCCVLCGASLGFLVYNWSPARIFMGDVGSLLLGLLYAVAAVLLWLDAYLTLPALLIALAGFWVDATYTLAVRILTRQRFFAAHRSHAYQRLALRHGHGAVAWRLVALNFGWLLPLAWLADQLALLGWGVLAVAVAPLLWLCNNLRAGAPETAASDRQTHVTL